MSFPEIVVLNLKLMKTYDSGTSPSYIFYGIFKGKVSLKEKEKIPWEGEFTLRIDP